MTDPVTEFASLAANALVDITDPAALVHAADEALASLEQHVGALPITHRHQGALVARVLWQLHSGQPRVAECATEDVLNWLRKALLMARGGWSAAGLMCAGKDIERASSIVDCLASEHRPLAELLRCVIGATERAAVELVVERQQGGGHVRAA